MFLRTLGYFTNRFLWAVTDADPYEEYEKHQQRKHAVGPKPLPDSLEDLKDLEQSDFSLDFSMQITETVLLLPLRPQAVNEPYFMLDAEKISISSTTEEKLGRFKPRPSLAMKMMKFIISCS